MSTILRTAAKDQWNVVQLECAVHACPVMLFRYGQDAKAVAGAVREGVKQVYWVADGADGARGWKVTLLPVL